MSTTSHKKVAIVGLGYVGLPLAVLAQAKGWPVSGIDIDSQRVALINAHQIPYQDEALQAMLIKHPIEATTDFAVIKNVDVVVVAVPTPVDDDQRPDLTPLREALKAMCPHFKGGQVLIIESTINPGVMDEIIIPLLHAKSNLRTDADQEGEESLYVAHCPERINPGDPKWNVSNIPRVLGGFSKSGTKRAHDFYHSIIDAPITILDTATEAEAVKILENTFRDVNIAFINEMAKSFDALGINISNVIAGAATKPFAFLPHYPGNGVGGHCISVDPYYMIERGRQAGFDHKFLKLARNINESMPSFTVDLLKRGLADRDKQLIDSTVAILGVAYKKNIVDTRNSPALKIRELLTEEGAHLNVFDPLIPDESTVSNLDDALRGADAIILACDHDVLTKQLTPALLQQHQVQIMIDSKNALDQGAFTDNNITYLGVGRP